MSKNLFAKITAFALSAAMSVTLLSGCGNNVTDKDEQGRTIISVGGWPTKEGKEKENIEAKKARFEEANKDFVIEPDSWIFDRKSFYAKAAAGQLPVLYDCGFTETAFDKYFGGDWLNRE